MYQKKAPSWMKHWDFEVIDILCMEFSFVIACLLRHIKMLDYLNTTTYLKMGVHLLLISIIVVFFLQSYKDILSRNKWQECTATFRHVTIVQMIFLLYEYLIKEAEILSRAVFLMTWIFSLLMCYFARVLWKKYIRNRIVSERPQNQILLITSIDNAERCLDDLYQKEYREFDVTCIALMKSQECISSIKGIPVLNGENAFMEYIRQEVVDEVIIDCFDSNSNMSELVDMFLGMGVTVHITMSFLPEHMPNKMVGRLGDVHVVTTSVKVASPWEIACKRLMDILGGIIGLFFTGIAYIFVAPVIMISSPGPIFFKQKRVGKNGRLFDIYKFRSMYMDAEERKKELMEYNEMQGLMFKMENDPRIIGSEKGPGKGIGNFIRKTSIDELPQFWNILKGEMSLVGTRPPTVNEYEQYELHHKIRLSTKPGLTGLWQVSGRSDITDFEEIVKLDAEYIENWSIKYDIKIILKTIKVVLQRSGSK